MEKLADDFIIFILIGAWILFVVYASIASSVGVHDNGTKSNHGGSLVSV